MIRLLGGVAWRRLKLFGCYTIGPFRCGKHSEGRESA